MSLLESELNLKIFSQSNIILKLAKFLNCLIVQTQLLSRFCMLHFCLKLKKTQALSSYFFSVFFFFFVSRFQNIFHFGYLEFDGISFSILDTSDNLQ